jgi:hypothetical protein
MAKKLILAGTLCSGVRSAQRASPARYFCFNCGNKITSQENRCSTRVSRVKFGVSPNFVGQRDWLFVNRRGTTWLVGTQADRKAMIQAD